MLKSYIDELLQKPIWYIFLISWLFYLVGLLLFSQFVWDRPTYLYDYSGDDFEKFIKGVRRIDMVRYALSPVWILLVSAVSWALIKVGSMVTKTRFDNKVLLKIVILGSVLISLLFWVKSIWFILIKGSYTPDEVKSFFPCSLVSLINTEDMSVSVIKVISKFNLFQLAFMCFISWMVTIKFELNYWKASLLIFLTYGLGLSILQMSKILFLV